MDEMHAFLRAIAETPDDDTPRLVFSDWLDDHGQPERAEFIRLQIALAHMVPGDEGYAEKTARMRRCGVLTGEARTPFFDHLPGECRIAFRRGFIEVIVTEWRGTGLADVSGLDLVPVQTLHTLDGQIGRFRGLAKLKQLEYHTHDVPAVRLLEVLGPGGWFPELEELRLPGFDAACLEAGAIPQFDLPRLRNFYLASQAFYNLGRPNRTDEDDYSEIGNRPWDGLPAYLPANAIPSPKSPLERFVWHSDDDCDYFNEEDWYWRGPAMESLLAHLKGRNLKQVEVLVDYEDHENGSEGIIAAPWMQNPLALCPTLEQVTLDDGDLERLAGSTGKLKALRVYGDDGGFHERLFALLALPVCSELKSLHLEARSGFWDKEPTTGPALDFPALRSLHVADLPLEFFANCSFPALVALSGQRGIKAILRRNWPKLQRLRVRLDDVADLPAFAQSDCCPVLTTLTIEGYFDPARDDFSFLAKCPQMPHLSLVCLPRYQMERAYVVDGGKLLLVRDDVIPDELPSATHFRVSVVF